MRATLKQDKTGNWNLTCKGMTEGKIITLVRALRLYNSPVANDILWAVRNGAYESKVIYGVIKGQIADVERNYPLAY